MKKRTIYALHQSHSSWLSPAPSLSWCPPHWGWQCPSGRQAPPKKLKLYSRTITKCTICHLVCKCFVKNGLTSIIGGSITAPSPSKENELLELKGRKSTLPIMDSTRRAPCGGGLKTTWPWSNLNDALFSTLLRKLNHLNIIVSF